MYNPQLFARTNHGLQLTEAGKSFLQDAKYLGALQKISLQ